MAPIRPALKGRSLSVQAVASVLVLALVLMGFPRAGRAQEERPTASAPSERTTNPAGQAERTEQERTAGEADQIPAIGGWGPWWAYVVTFAVGVGAVLGGVWLVRKLLTRKRSALHLQLDPAIVTFDVTEVGQMATRRVVMRNREVKPVRITGFSVSRGPFSLFDVPPLPAVLPPGERLEFGVRFQPSQACGCSGELHIVSDAPRGSLEVSIRGRAIERPPAGGPERRSHRAGRATPPGSGAYDVRAAVSAWGSFQVRNTRDRGLTSPSIPSWNQLLAWLQNLERFRRACEVT